MREIPLTQGQVAIVDDDDYALLSQWKWCAHWDPKASSFYAVRSQHVEGRWCTKRMHRVLMGLETGDKKQVDHRSGDTLDNRRSNLRIVSLRQNGQNRRIHRAGKLPGASLPRPWGKWQARMRVKGRLIHLGMFPTEQLAHERYVEELAKLDEVLV
jgi:hypothetical protein